MTVIGTLSTCVSQLPLERRTTDPAIGTGGRVRASRTDDVMTDWAGSATEWSRATILKETLPRYANSPI
jgi:hypothetical protein